MHQDANTLVEMNNIVKVYGESGVCALDHAWLGVAAGTVHAVVGENGTGKSTLAKILSGYTRPDAGTLRIGASPTRFRAPADALRAGIGMIHQHPTVVPELSAWENMRLAFGPVRVGSHGPFSTGTDEPLRSRLRRICDQYEMDLPLEKRASSLSKSEVIRLWMAALMLRGVRLLILDEPGSTFTPAEHHWLHGAMRRMTEEGRTVLLITHKLGSVFESADAVTVMRRGRTVLSAATSEIDERVVAGEMMGTHSPQYIRLHVTASKSPTAPSASTAPTAPSIATGPSARPSGRRLGAADGSPSAVHVPVFALKHVTVRQNGTALLDNVNLTVYPGQVTAATGIRETGLNILEDVCAGNVKPSEGTIEYKGEGHATVTPRRLRDERIGYIPTDRFGSGAATEARATDNLIMAERRRMQRNGFLIRARIRRHSARLLHDYRVGGRASGLLKTLSGGNIQKTIIAREFEFADSLLIYAEPFWGLDVRSQETIADHMQRLVGRGAGILLIATDMDDVLRLADRVVVLHDGKSVADLPTAGLRRDVLGDYILGYRTDE